MLWCLCPLQFPLEFFQLDPYSLNLDGVNVVLVRDHLNLGGLSILSTFAFAFVIGYFIIHFISAMEIIFWNALRLIFWPLFAYVVSLILMKNIQTSKGSEIYKFIYISMQYSY